MRLTPLRRTTALLLGAALLAGCRDGGEEDTALPADTLQAGAHAALSDGEVVHAVLTAAEVGAEAAARARGTAEHPDVGRFAAVLHADQNALQSIFVGLAQTAGVQAAENAVSGELRTIGQRVGERTQNLSGRAFDEAFLQGEIEFYQALLDAVDSRLLASARNDELRGTLRDARPTYEAHLQRALQIRSELAYAAAAPAAETPVMPAEARPAEQAPPAAQAAPPAARQTPPAQQTPPPPAQQPPPRPPIRDTIVIRPPPDTIPNH